MKIKSVVFAGALALAAPSLVHAQEAPQTSLTEMELAREIVDRGYPAETRMEMFTGFVGEMIDQFIASNPDLTREPQLRAAVDRYSGRVVSLTEEVLSDHIDDLMEALVIGYSEHFTRAELEGLHAFISSEAGHGFLARSTQIMAHPLVAEANQRYMADYMARVPALQAEFQADLMRIIDEQRK